VRYDLSSLSLEERVFWHSRRVEKELPAHLFVEQFVSAYSTKILENILAQVRKERAYLSVLILLKNNSKFSALYVECVQKKKKLNKLSAQKCTLLCDKIKGKFFNNRRFQALEGELRQATREWENVRGQLREMCKILGLTWEQLYVD